MEDVVRDNKRQDVQSSSQIVPTNKPTPRVSQAGCFLSLNHVSKQWNKNANSQLVVTKTMTKP